MPHRSVVFVSHANPEDNPFARWLSLKLAALGYNVWSDVTKLLGGEDFWQEIEVIIRNSAAKFLYVLSHTSNHREGVLRELRVANAVQKKTGDLNDFIIPIRIDDLPHGETNIEIGRLNVIEFSANWASGLKQLCRKFEADGVPRSLPGGPDVVRRWWEREFAVDSGVDDTPELHYSNWFPLQLTDRIYRYSPIGLVDPEPQLPFPIRWHEGRLVTFASRSEVEQSLGSLRIQDVEAFKTMSFLSEESQRRQDNRNIVVGILADARGSSSRHREN